MNRRLLLVLSFVAVAALLGYLRDPPWLIRIESGFRKWETAADGTRYRWTDGHASFFVRSDAGQLEIPIRTAGSTSSDMPIAVSLTIDDRPADQLLLVNDGEWRRVKVILPARGTRRVRRIDIRVDRTKDGNRGVQVGAVQVR